MENKKYFLVTGLVFAVFFSSLLVLVRTENLCFFEGPDTSEDNLTLSDFMIEGPENPKVGDQLRVKFSLKNIGEPINLTDKGVFAAAKVRYYEDREFGSTSADQALGTNDIVNFDENITIDKNGSWKIWPSYEYLKRTYSEVLERYIYMKKKGPSNWHFCDLAICPYYCENGIRYYNGYADQNGLCGYLNETCEYGCNEEGTDCSNVSRIEITEGPVYYLWWASTDECVPSFTVEWKTNIEGNGTIFYRKTGGTTWQEVEAPPPYCTEEGCEYDLDHNFILLEPNTTYYYYVKSCGPYDCAQSPEYESFTTTSYLDINNVQVSNITERTATVSWKTRCWDPESDWEGSHPTNYTLYVVRTSYANLPNPPWSEVSNSTFKGRHTALLSGMLEEGRNYTFYILACDEDEYCAESGRYTFVTGEQAFPQIINMNIEHSHTSVDISWSTFRYVNTTVYLYDAGDLIRWQEVKSDSDRISLHSFNFDGLQQGTGYAFLVEHCTPVLCNTTQIYYFTTTSCRDGIRNGGEEDVDCGGPCPTCPTCYDGIWNGNEEGIDCGGDCPSSCEQACEPLVFNGEQEGKINVVFVMDEDYNGNLTEFLKDVRQLIYQGYYGSGIISENRCKFNFYYVRGEGDAEDICSRLDLPDNFHRNCPSAHSIAIVHKTDFRDCASGNVFSTENDEFRTVVHESGHAIFGLADEYCCDGGYWEGEGCPNIFETGGNCRSYANSNGMNPDHCFEYCPDKKCWPTGSGIRDCINDFTSRGWDTNGCNCTAFAIAEGKDLNDCETANPSDCPPFWLEFWRNHGVNTNDVTVMSPNWCHYRGPDVRECCDSGWWKSDPDDLNTLNPGSCMMQSGADFGESCQMCVNQKFDSLPYCPPHRE